MILDSTFLVDLERETRQAKEGKASRFLQQHGDEQLQITFTIAGELAAGASLAGNRDRWTEFLRPFEILGATEEVTWRFGTVYRDLKKRGQLIGSNDLWIAATALANSQPLVTRNHDDFQRVGGLVVAIY